jgi:hypothetical protein
MTMKVRQFNEEGVAKFRDYLVGLRADPALPPPFEYLEDDGLTTHVKGVAFVKNVPIPTRMDAAKYLKQALQNLDPDEFENNNMWAWLSLFFFDQLCPINASGKRKVGKTHRYIPSNDYKVHYRHLLKTPFLIFLSHGISGRLLLSNPVYKAGEINEQIASRQKIVGSSGVMQALDLLFFDEKTQAPRKGITTRKTIKPGTLDRFWRVLSQLELTYDVQSLKSADLIDLLPKEFDAKRS